MLSFVLICFLLLGQTWSNPITDGTKLVSTILIHRHGDRTPIEETTFISNNPTALQDASSEYGYGQLTKVGTQRAYELGKFIRHRYGQFLSPQYNLSEIYIRSTDSTRTKKTVLTAMAAVYPAYPGSWSKHINWVPTPYTTVPTKYDFNLAEINCPNFMTFYYGVYASNPTRMQKHFHVLNVLSEASGYNITEMPILVISYFDLYVSQLSLGIPLAADIAAVWPEIQDAADDAYDILLGNDDYVALQAGVMLNEFFTQSDNIISGTDTPRFRVYSAHDYNVYSFLAAAKAVPRQGAPKYCSVFGLELRQVVETGQYVVLPIYKPSPDEEVKYLKISGCGRYCDYYEYKELVSANTLDEDTWRTDCGFTEYLEVDDSTIA